MILPLLDSRSCLGSDIHRRARSREPDQESSSYVGDSFTLHVIRVVVAQLGAIYRISAPELAVFVEADTFRETWCKFLETVRLRDDAAWLLFDVGPTRREEIDAGLESMEDEDWAEPTGDVGAD